MKTTSYQKIQNRQSIPIGRRKNMCKKYGHNFQESERYGTEQVMCCIDCGKIEACHADDKEKISYLMRRMIVQPFQEQAWADLHGENILLGIDSTNQ